MDELEKTFPDKSDLRNALEGYFHIYDDKAAFTVEEFNNYLADYFSSSEYPIENSRKINSWLTKPGEAFIEVNISHTNYGWKAVDENGKPSGKGVKEFKNIKDAQNSEIYRELVKRYGKENVRIQIQS